MKIIKLVYIILALSFSSFCNAFYNAVTEYLGEWKVQVEYKEKYFEYDMNYILNTYEIGPVLKGMDQNFVVRLGLPNDYFVSFDANYVFQNLEGLFDYNNVQSIRLLTGKIPANNIGIILGLNITLPTFINSDLRLINKSDAYNIIAGAIYNGKFGILSYAAQAFFERAIRDTNYQGGFDTSAVLGFNFYDDPSTQVIDILAELNYALIQRGSENSSVFKLIPQAKVKFYNDFTFIIGMEILLDAQNSYLNAQDKILYVMKVNYILNSSNRNVAAVGITPTVSAVMPKSVTNTASPLPLSGTAAVK